MTKQATQARITRGEDPAEGGPGAEQDQTNGMTGDDNRRDKGIIGFWQDRNMKIFDIRITDVMAKSYKDGSTNHTIQKWGNLKKWNHPQFFLEACRNFTPLVFSVEGCLGKQTRGSQKTGRTPKQEVGQRTCGYVQVCASMPVLKTH